MIYRLDEVTEQKLPESKTYKVCVYTICKNESKHIQRWMWHLQDADLIYILDTGSTDNSVELFQQYSKVKIDTFLQDDFDFSVARNECYKNARKYCDGDIHDWVFITLDLDEFLDRDGIQRLKYHWNDKLDTHIVEEVLDDVPTFRMHKIHSSSDHWKWHFKVHEVPLLDNKNTVDWKIGNYTKIQYRHEQDLSKVRPYFQMMEKMTAAEPSARTYSNMMWEAHDAGHLELTTDLASKAIDAILHNEKDMNYLDPIMIANCYVNKAFALYEMFQYDDAIATLDEFEEFYHQHSTYVNRTVNGLRATILSKQAKYRECIKKLLEILETNTYYLPTIDFDPWDTDAPVYMLLAQTYSELGDYHNAQLYAKLAAKHFEDKERTKG